MSGKPIIVTTTTPDHASPDQIPAGTPGSAPGNTLGQSALLRQLIPFTIVNFLGFLAVGVPLPVLPIYVKGDLGFGSIIIGIVVGLQALATLTTRQFAGRFCDARGVKLATLLGLGSASLAGLFYLLSSLTAGYLTNGQAFLGLGLLVIGRLIMGLGESLFITALSAWNIARVGPAYAGRVMAWSGIAMYGALALGAPIGLAIDQFGGFRAVAAGTMLLPACGAVVAALMVGAAIQPVQRASALRVLRSIWMPGLSMALASSGIGVIVAFLTLRYQMAGWSHAGLALTGFGAGYIIMRLIFGGLPDRLGGYLTASFSLAGEAIGLLILWQASSSLMAFAGASFIGLSYSLVFPSLGVEAIRRVPGENRGLVLGTYFACFDLGLAAAGPVAGIVIQFFGLPAAFLFAAIAAVVAFGLTRLASTKR